MTSVSNFLQNFLEAEREGATWKSFKGIVTLQSQVALTSGLVSHGLITTEFDADAAGATQDPEDLEERGGAGGWLYRAADVLTQESVTTGGAEVLRKVITTLAMRKLHAGMVMNWMINNATGGNITFSVFGRAYVLLS